MQAVMTGAYCRKAFPPNFWGILADNRYKAILNKHDFLMKKSISSQVLIILDIFD